LEFFREYQTVIFRSLGAILLIVGFVVNFWAMPKSAVTKNSIAAANVARMEASVAGSTTKTVEKKPEVSHISKALKATREKQMRYLTIFSMIIGVLFLAYSFVKKEQ